MGSHYHRYGTSLAIWDHTVLPATRHKWTRPALTPASKMWRNHGHHKMGGNHLSNARAYVMQTTDIAEADRYSYCFIELVYILTYPIHSASGGTAATSPPPVQAWWSYFLWEPIPSDPHFLGTVSRALCAEASSCWKVNKVTWHCTDGR